MLDIIIIIALCVSMSKKFRENGKIGAGKYIAGIIGSIIVGEILMVIVMYVVFENYYYDGPGILLAFLPIILGYVVAGIIYNAGKKEALYGGTINPLYQNQPLPNQYPGQQFPNQQYTNPQFLNQQFSNQGYQMPQAPVYNPVEQQPTVCKAYANGKCAPYGNDSGYQCDFDPNNWQNCQVVKSNVQSYGVW